MVDEPLVTTVVTSCTTDRLDSIREPLDSIGRQTYRHLETALAAERPAKLFNAVVGHIREKSPANTRAVFNEGTTGLSSARRAATAG